MEPNKLIKQLKKASDAYYNGSPIMTDAEFDIKVDELRKLDPENQFLKEIGAPPKDSKFAKVKHEIIHGSQHKVNSEQEFREWCSKKNTEGPFVVQHKLDGITLVLKYENDELISAATRGNGVEGEEIITNAVHVKNVKKKIDKFSGTVRGEVVLPLTAFSNYFAKNAKRAYRNARNSLSVIRSDEFDLIKHFAFKPFDLIGEDFKTEMALNNRLKSMFGDAVETVRAETIDDVIEIYSDYIATKRNKLDHLIDGLVIRIDNRDVQEALGHTDNRPNGQIAFKFPPETAPTVIKDIEWGMGTTGRLGSTAILEPVDVNGITIKRCTLNNVDWMRQMNVGIGDKVMIGRMNDVIPGVVKVLDRSGRTKGKDPFNLPKKCPCCSGTLAIEGVYFVCPNLECSGVTFGNIMRWVVSHNMLGFGASHVREMISRGFDAPHKIYSMTLNDLTEITGSEKIAKKLMNVISKTKEVNLDRFLYGLNVDTLGNTNSRRLAKKFDNLNAVLSASAEDIAKIEGIKTNSTKIVIGLKAKANEIAELLKHVKPVDMQSSGPLAGASFCCTGELWDKRPTIHQKIIAAGGEVKTSVGKGLTFLVTNDPSSGTSKNKKAQKLGVDIIDGDSLKKLLNNEVKWKELQNG